MFTGIVEELGEVVTVERGEQSAIVRIRGPLVTEDASHGDSIAVNGVCLTVTSVEDGTFTADVMEETLQRSKLGRQPRDITPPWRTRLLEPADIWRDVTKR